MALEISYLELLPKEYKKAVKILLKKLQNANQFSVKYRLLQTFIEKYTGLPEIFGFETINNQRDSSDIKLKWHGGAILERARKDFPQYDRKEWPNFDKHLCKNLNRDDTTKFFLTLPHSKLSLVHQIFEEESEYSSYYAEKYELACKIYEEMEECDINDGEKYIEILKKTKNDEFININIEIRLARNPWCKQFWMSYINYLEHERKDFKALLSVLQKYCRIFICDKIMKEKYPLKIEELSHVFNGIWKFWIDAIKFELQFNYGDAAMDMLDKALKTDMYEKMKLLDAAVELAEQFRQTKMIEKVEEARKAYLKEHPDADVYNFNKVIENLTFYSTTKMPKLPFSKTIKYRYGSNAAVTNVIRWGMITEGGSRDFIKNARELEKESLKNFPALLNLEWPIFDEKFFFNKEKTTEDLLEYLEFLLSFPHSKLPLALITFKELSTSAPETHKNMIKYSKNMEIYKEMRATDIKDGEKFVGILKKTENDEFVIKNIECQLAKTPWCQSLWIAYIHFLQENEKKDGMALLSVLQRYCRLFFGDKAMKEKYRSKIKEFNQSLDGISEFWIDSIKFELQFSSLDAAMAILENALKSKMFDNVKFFDAAVELAEQFRQPNMTKKIHESKIIYLKEHPEIDSYNFNNVIKNLNFEAIKFQKFPFSKPINRYLYDNIDHHHLQKLYQTCKWFYYKYRYNLVHKLEIEKRCTEILDHGFPCGIQYVKFRGNSLLFSPCQIDTTPNIKNLWLTNSLNICDNRKMSHVVSKISKVTLKYLQLSATNITKNEFEILIKSKTIVVLDLQQSIKDENGEYMVVEDILKNVPNARQIKVNPAYSTSNTADALLSLKFQNKYDFLDLEFKPQIDAALYYEFLEKNLQDKAQVHLHCRTTEFRNQMKKYFSKWHPKKGTPNVWW